MRYTILAFLVGILALAPAAQGQEAPASSLKGKFLVADPAMPDPRFANTVIYMIAHSDDGAMGIVINRPGAKRPVTELLRALGLDLREGQGAGVELQLFWGGPVQLERVLLVHSDDFKTESTLVVAPGIALSPPREALAAIAEGRGPKHTILAAGYAGWSPGQLERELEMKGWAVIGGDAELLFGADHAEKWERAWRSRTQDL